MISTLLLLCYYAIVCLCLFDMIVELHGMDPNDFSLEREKRISFSTKSMYDIWAQAWSSTQLHYPRQV